MKKSEISPIKFSSISEAHKAFGLSEPLHPLITIFDGSQEQHISRPQGTHVLHFYKISYKPELSGKVKYGQGYYDFNEGGLLFAAPNQIVGGVEPGELADACSLYTMLIHPDFFWNYPLAKKIKQYGFFSYAANETLHLSASEKATIISIFQMIETELKSRIDDFSQDVVISQIELLLNFANRFYKRQFITRKAASGDLLQKLEVLLDDYFDNEKTVTNGLPTVQYLSEHLNITPSYLSDMLRSLIGHNAQQHIHIKLIEKAKELLSTTTLSVSQVAFQLGFEHSQSFNKLFKKKTNISPLEFRQAFN